MRLAPTHIIALLCALLLGGCSLLDKGTDDSRLTITNKGCEVDVSQHGKIAGLAGTTFSEDIRIEPDCTVVIKVSDAVHVELPSVGDHASENEEAETAAQKAASQAQKTPQTDEGN